MKVAFESSFARDLREHQDKQLLGRVQKAIELVKNAPDVASMRSLKKLQGYESYYRIRLGDYRIGVEISDDQVIFVRFLHRRDIYRYFP